MYKIMYRRQWLKAIPNQRDEAACTAFALCSIINWFKDPKYKAEGLEREYLNGSDFFALVNSKYPEDIQGPLTTTQALVYAKEMGYIKEYTSFKLEQINYEIFKLMLKAGALLLLNVNKIDRDKISASNPVAQYAQGGVPHAVACVDYDDENKVIKILNSRGEEFWDRGYFYIKAEDIPQMVSWVNLVVDADDKENMAKLNYKNMLSKAIKILSAQRKYGTEDEQQAMNFANSMLRKVCLKQDHQYNMDKKKAVDFINRYF